MKSKLMTAVEVALIVAVVYCNGLLIQTPMVDSWSMSMLDKYSQTIIEIAFLDQYLKQHPESYQAYRARAQAFAVDSHWQSAVESATKAIELNKDDLASYAVRAYSNYNLGQDELAISDYDRVVSAGQATAQDFAYRSLANFRSNKFAQSAIDGQSAVSKDENYPVAYYARAVNEYHDGKSREALYDAKIAYQLDVKSPLPYSLLAKIFTDEKRYNHAIATCDDGLQFDPTYGATHLQKAIAQEKLGEYQESIDSCTMALSLMQSKAERSNAYAIRALSRLHRNSAQSAIDDCKKALEADSDCWLAHDVRAQIYDKLDSKVQALADRELAKQIKARTEGH